MLRHGAGLVVVLLIGCSAGESDGPAFEDWTFAGTWRGGFVGANANMSAVLTLTEQDTLLLGSGYISGSGLECAVTIDGSRNGERVALDLICPPYRPIRYRGSRTAATRIEGTIAGSGIIQSEMDLVKQ